MFLDLPRASPGPVPLIKIQFLIPLHAALGTRALHPPTPRRAKRKEYRAILHSSCEINFFRYKESIQQPNTTSLSNHHFSSNITQHHHNLSPNPSSPHLWVATPPQSDGGERSRRGPLDLGGRSPKSLGARSAKKLRSVSRRGRFLQKNDHDRVLSSTPRNPNFLPLVSRSALTTRRPGLHDHRLLLLVTTQASDARHRMPPPAVTAILKDLREGNPENRFEPGPSCVDTGGWSVCAAPCAQRTPPRSGAFRKF